MDNQDQDDRDIEDIISDEIPSVKGNLDSSNIAKSFKVYADIVSKKDKAYDYIPSKPTLTSKFLTKIAKLNAAIDKYIKKKGKLTESYLASKLRYLPYVYRDSIRNHLRTTHLHNDSVAILLSQWDDVCVIADQKIPTVTKYSKQRAIWDVIEVSAPMIVDDSLWYVRVLYHRKNKDKYIDIREWKQNESTMEFEPTMNGVCVTLNQNLKLLYVIGKMMSKHKE